MKKVLGALSRFLRPKTKLFAVKFRRILEVLCLQGLQIKLWAHFHDLSVKKWSCFLRSSDGFQKFSPCEVYKKVLGALSRLLRPKTKLFAAKFRRILEVLCLQGLHWKFWAQFHGLCVQRRSCLPWSSDAFWKFFACKFGRKGSGRIFTIFASKNEAVCREIQTHFGRSPHSRLQKDFWAHFHDLCVQKQSVQKLNC